MGATLPFHFGACMGALMATRKAERAKAKNAEAGVDDGSSDASNPGSEVSGRSNAEVIDLARRSLFDAIPGSAVALADGAKEGSVPHIKLLLQLVGLDDGELAIVVVQPEEKAFADSISEVWDRESRAG